MANPWEKYKDAEVVDAPPTDEGTTGADGGALPWQKYEGANVLDKQPETEVQERTRQATETYLARPKLKTNNSGTLGGWTIQAGRAATLGASDYLTAGLLWAFPKEGMDPDASYGDVLAATKAALDEDKTWTAELAGSMLPAAAVGKAVMKVGGAATKAAVKTGVVDGSMRWGARHPALSRIVKATGIGAGTGGAYEALRVGVEQSITATTGEGFDTGRVVEGMVTGAVIGAVMTPVTNEAMRGAVGVASWVKNAITGNDAARTQRATIQVLKTLRSGKETPDETVMRLRNDAEKFKQMYGRAPSLAELTSPEKAQSLTRVVAYHAGLDEQAREMGEAQIMRVLTSFDDVVRDGDKLLDTAVVMGRMEDMFNGLMAKEGRRQVALTDNAYYALERNKSFLTRMAATNDEARAILRVVDAKAKVKGFRDRASKLQAQYNVAAAKQEVAELGDEIAELIADMQQGATPPSELARLKMRFDRLNAAQKALAADTAADLKEQALINAKAQVAAIERELAEFETNGITMSLSTANGMRSNASRMATEGVDPLARDEARYVRDAIAEVGTAEVPMYRAVVQGWHKAMTITEAQGMGADALKRTGISTDNLREALKRGRVPGRPKAKDATNVRHGAGQGARIALSRAAKQGEKSAMQAISPLVEGSEQAANLRLAAPKHAERILGAAQQTDKSVRGLRGAMRNISPDNLDAQAEMLKELASGAFVGTLGGAAKAHVVARVLGRFRFSRPVAKKIVDMALDPDKAEDVLRYVAKQGVDAGEFMAVFGAALRGVAE